VPSQPRRACPRRAVPLAAMASPAELDAPLAELRRQEAELKAELKAALAATEKRPKPYTSWMRGVALRTFALTDCDLEAPLQYLKTKGRSGSEPDVRAWHAALSPGDQAKLLTPSPDDKLAARQLAEARKFIGEMRLVSWARGQNSSKGLAPTSSLILEQAGPDLVRGRSRKNKYRWVRKCMRRWSGFRSRFACGDRLSQEEFREKAGPAPEPRT